MAGLDITAVREAIAAQLRAANIDGLSVYAYDPGVPPSYPAAVIGWATNEPNFTFTMGAQGIAEVSLIVQLRSSAANDEDAARSLDALFSAGTGANRSVFDALHADFTFGGAVGGGGIGATRPPVRAVDQNGNPMWTAGFVVTVYQARS